MVQVIQFSTRELTEKCSVIWIVQFWLVSVQF